MKELRQRMLTLPSTCLGWVALFGAVIMSIGFLLLGITAFNGGPPSPVEEPGSPMYVRGRVVARLRLPRTVVPWQIVQVNDDGSVTRGLNPVQPDKSTRILLTAAEQHELEVFRLRWCQQIPDFRLLEPNEPFYDLGFVCGSPYELKQARVPVEMLPPIFIGILKRLPQIL
jgi:hypothetical protein